MIDDSETVRRIAVRTLTAAGFEVAEAHDGRHGLEVAQQVVPDVVFVDAVMPELDGEAFCRALRRISNLQDVPVVLMSARATKIATRFMATTGAIDAIAKPFSPDALLAVAWHAVERTAPLEAAPAALGVPAEPARTEAAPLRALLTERGLDVARWSDDDLLQVGDEIAEIVRGGESAFAGRLEHLALGEVLQMLEHQAQQGVLRVTDDGGQHIEICLRAGKVDLALGHVGRMEFLLGRYLVGEGLIDAGDLERLLERRRKAADHDPFLGTMLIKLGYIGREDLLGVLARQTSELVYEALRWPRGRFEFTRFAVRPAAKDAALELPVTGMLMEGLRRVDEWRLIEEQVTDFDRVVSVDRHALTEAQRERMNALERTVVDAIDGQRSVRAIIEHTRLASFDVCKVLYQLLSTRLVR